MRQPHPGLKCGFCSETTKDRRASARFHSIELKRFLRIMLNCSCCGLTTSCDTEMELKAKTKRVNESQRHKERLNGSFEQMN